ARAGHVPDGARGGPRALGASRPPRARALGGPAPARGPRPRRGLSAAPAGALWARLADRVRDPWRAFGLLEAGAGAASLACFGLLGPWLPALQARAHAALLPAIGSLLAACIHMVLAPIALLLVPTVLLGAAFPAVARLACGTDRVGRDVGAVAAFNTLGGIVGTLATGFVVVPAIGLSRALALLAVAMAVVG